METWKNITYAPDLFFSPFSSLQKALRPPEADAWFLCLDKEKSNVVILRTLSIPKSLTATFQKWRKMVYSNFKSLKQLVKHFDLKVQKTRLWLEITPVAPSEWLKASVEMAYLGMKKQ